MSTPNDDPLSAAVADLVAAGTTEKLADPLVTETVQDVSAEASESIANALPKVGAGPVGGSGPRTGGDLMIKNAELQVITPQDMIGWHVVLSVKLDLPNFPVIVCSWPLEELVEKAPTQELAAMVGADSPELLTKPFIWTTIWPHPEKGESQGKYAGLKPLEEKTKKRNYGDEMWVLDSATKTGPNTGTAIYRLDRTVLRQRNLNVVMQAQNSEIPPEVAYALNRPDLIGQPIGTLATQAPVPAPESVSAVALAEVLKADPGLLQQALSLATGEADSPVAHGSEVGSEVGSAPGDEETP